MPTVGAKALPWFCSSCRDRVPGKGFPSRRRWREAGRTVSGAPAHSQLGRSPAHSPSSPVASSLGGLAGFLPVPKAEALMALTKLPSQKTQFLSKLGSLSPIPGAHVTDETVLCHTHMGHTHVYIHTPKTTLEKGRVLPSERTKLPRDPTPRGHSPAEQWLEHMIRGYLGDPHKNRGRHSVKEAWVIG